MKKSEIIRSLRHFKEMNRDKYRIIRLGLFGSAARDTLEEPHDVDVVVEMTEPDLFSLIGIKQDLEGQLRRPGM